MEQATGPINNSNTNDAALHLPKQSDAKSEVTSESQEKLNQRREARRRKILDNAKSRMEKLGVKGTNFKTNDDQQNGFFQYPDPEVEPNEIKFPFSNLIDSSENIGSSERYDPFADEKPVKDPLIFKYRLHVLVSITITYMFALIGLIGKYSILIPTCICMGLQVLFRKPKPVNPITALVITLCKLPSREVNIIWRLSAIVYDLIIDLGLTVFCIVTLTLVHDFMSGNNLLTLK